MITKRLRISYLHIIQNKMPSRIIGMAFYFINGRIYFFMMLLQPFQILKPKKMQVDPLPCYVASFSCILNQLKWCMDSLSQGFNHA